MAEEKVGEAKGKSKKLIKKEKKKQKKQALKNVPSGDPILRKRMSNLPCGQKKVL